jgi:hypothetical protein
MSNCTSLFTGVRKSLLFCVRNMCCLYIYMLIAFQVGAPLDC